MWKVLFPIAVKIAIFIVIMGIVGYWADFAKERIKLWRSRK